MRKILALISFSVIAFLAKAQTGYVSQMGYKDYSVYGSMNIGSGKLKTTDPWAYLELGDSINSRKLFILPRGNKDSVLFPKYGGLFFDYPTRKFKGFNGIEWVNFAVSSAGDSSALSDYLKKTDTIGLFNGYLKKVTADGLYEALANKSTSTSLGTSNSLYPTQNAVKVYVDNAVAGAAGSVASVFGRTGVVAAQSGDYSAFYPLLSGSYANPAWLTALAWPKITGTPTTISGYGITDAFNGDYNNLTNKPTIPAAQVNSDWNAASGLAQILNKPSLSTVATSGSYNDLSDKPTIPSSQVNSDWNASTGVAQVLNKPTLATVATTGSYNDLSNKPSIPSAQVNSDWNASSGIAQILNKPTLATVATTGSYTDLSNKPTIPTNNNQLTNGAGYLTNITGLVTAGTNMTRTGSGTTGDPYVFNSTATGGVTSETDPNAILKTGTSTLTGNVTLAGANNYFRFQNARVQWGTGTAVTAANSLTLGNDGNTFPISGSTQINAISTTNWQSGSTINLVFLGTPTVKHNTSGSAGTATIDLAGDLDYIASVGDVLTLLYDGTNWKETGRKVTGGQGVKTNYWTATGNGIYNNNSGGVGIGTSTLTGKLTVTDNSLASNTISDASGLVLANQQTASSGNQMYSMPLVFQGSGYKTAATAGAQDLRWRMVLQPVQGAANPSANLLLQYSINGAAYTTKMSMPTGTGTTAFTNQISADAVNTATVNNTGASILGGVITNNRSTAYSSGTNTDNVFSWTGGIVNTGGTNTIRGIYIAPTTSNLTGTTYRAAEIVNGDSFFGTTSGGISVGATTSMDGSAILQVTSTTRGTLLSRMTKTQRNAISNPSPGLLVIVTGESGGEYLSWYNSSLTAWVKVTSTTD